MKQQNLPRISAAWFLSGVPVLHLDWKPSGNHLLQERRLQYQGLGLIACNPFYQSFLESSLCKCVVVHHSGLKCSCPLFIVESSYLPGSSTQHPFTVSLYTYISLSLFSFFCENVRILYLKEDFFACENIRLASLHSKHASQPCLFCFHIQT